MFEQLKVDRSEANVPVAAANAPGLSIEIEVTGVKSFCDPFRPAAAEQSVDAGHQLLYRKRLDDVVVRADGEAAHALRFFAAAADHDDWQGAGRLSCSQAAANLNAR